MPVVLGFHSWRLALTVHELTVGTRQKQSPYLQDGAERSRGVEAN